LFREVETAILDRDLCAVLAMVKTAKPRTLTIRERWRIVELQESKWSQKRIARECKCSLQAVRRWIRRHKETGTVDDRPKTGRTPVLTHEQAEGALKHLISGQFAGAAHVATHLRHAKITPMTLHKSTIIRHAKKAARSDGDKLKVRRGRPPKGLTGTTISKRLAFALKCVGFPWDLVMFTDRKRFYFRYPGSRVRMIRWLLDSSEKDSSEGVFQPNNPNCFNIYVGITRHGATTAHEVAGSTGFKHQHVNGKGQKAKNITKGQYQEVVGKTFLPEGDRMFDTTRWYLQQDNDPTHSVAGGVVLDWNKKHGKAIEMLEGWPPSSPDLSIIENFWSHIESEANAAGCKTLEEFKNCIKMLVNSRSKDMMAYLSTLYDSMPKRMEEVIRLKGKKTKY